MIVLDASAALSALLNDGPARQVAGDDQLHAPHLIDAEVVNGLRRLAAARTVPVAAARAALRTWPRLAVTRYPLVGLLDRVWELRDTVSAYDAAYVALAESLDCVLVTADARLSRASGPRCAVTVVPR
ncbi:MAG TPA: type II toxin-antitoxin system VapC family toxin [Acidimicrobiales bacterium]|nr:type II toxin-antitoxin system VapC family toxin [Acidimicrobiales bacterium]